MSAGMDMDVVLWCTMGRGWGCRILNMNGMGSVALWINKMCFVVGSGI